MSDIPRGRAILETALRSDDVKLPHYSIRQALDLLTREKPAGGFMVKPHMPPMTKAQVREARRLLANGMGLHEIGKLLGQNIGRGSEAVNGLREGMNATK